MEEAAAVAGGDGDDFGVVADGLASAAFRVMVGGVFFPFFKFERAAMDLSGLRLHPGFDSPAWKPLASGTSWQKATTHSPSR